MTPDPSPDLSLDPSFASSQQRRAVLGRLGENFVAQWLRQEGWQIIEQQWHCRWGELDIIAHHPHEKAIAFVEVKTRSRGNWDADGRLAITPQKQAKLWQAAELFLSSHEQWASANGQFDVALVVCDRRSPLHPLQRHKKQHEALMDHAATDHKSDSLIILGSPMQYHQHWLTLQDYIPHAFS